MLFSILFTLGSAAVGHFVLWLIVKFFGQGGDGLLGDIRTAIGRALPLPLGIAIWIVATTSVVQKIISLYEWQNVISFLAGDVVINLATLISMKLTAILILLATWFVVRAVRAFADILDKWHSEKEGIELDTTAIQALTSVGVVLIWLV